MVLKEKLGRRKLLRMAVAVAATVVVEPVLSAAQKMMRTLTRTPTQTAGPFYPRKPQTDKDLDLTQIMGRTHSAKGKVIAVQGKVLDEKGEAVVGALVEIWQANTYGRYRHERDSNPAPLDPDFQGWGQILSGGDGVYGFKTIMPGAYPANVDWVRPPHIHFKVVKRGYVELVTQMYFPGNELNKGDLILQSLTDAQQLRVVARRRSNNQQRQNPLSSQFVFDIVLAEVE